MFRKLAFAAVGFGMLSACVDAQDPSMTSSSTARPASASIAEIAAPGQDLSRVKVDPTNGCYVYRHRGPVETIYIPVRTVSGSPICTRAQS